MVTWQGVPVVVDQAKAMMMDRARKLAGEFELADWSSRRHGLGDWVYVRAGRTPECSYVGGRAIFYDNACPALLSPIVV